MRYWAHVYNSLFRFNGNYEEARIFSSPKLHVFLASLDFSVGTSEMNISANCKYLSPKFSVFSWTQQRGDPSTLDVHQSPLFCRSKNLLSLPKLFDEEHVCQCVFCLFGIVVTTILTGDVFTDNRAPQILLLLDCKICFAPKSLLNRVKQLSAGLFKSKIETVGTYVEVP